MTGPTLLERGGEALPDSVRRFARRARRRRWRTARTYATLATVVVLLVAAGVVVWGTSVFSVRTVTVRGERTIPAAQLLSAAAVPKGANLARLSTGAIADRVLAAFPPVASVSVHRSFPSTVQIEVTERTVVATAHVDKAGYALVDRDGVVFRPVSSPAKGYPLIVVPTLQSRSAAVVAAAHVVAALPAGLRPLVSSVWATGGQSVTLHLTKGRTVFWGGADDSTRKYLVLRTLIAHPPPGGIDHIDVSSPDAVTVG